MEEVAKRITAAGGSAHAAVINALDDTAVNEYLDGIVKQTGKIDILLDAAGPLAKEYGNGKIAADLPIEEFMVPLTTMVKSRFITARPRRCTSDDRAALGGDHFHDRQSGSRTRARCHRDRRGIWRNRESR